MTHAPPPRRSFPLVAGVLLGIGLGGFADGIVFHQLLQWHHMATSAGYPPDTVASLRFNTTLDGAFHAATWIITVLGLVLFWRAARLPHVRWRAPALAATLLMGFGLFNLVEWVVDHLILGLHHVNETVPRAHWPLWDWAFILSGAVMLGLGFLIWRRPSVP